MDISDEQYEKWAKDLCDDCSGDKDGHCYIWTTGRCCHVEDDEIE